MTPGITKQNNKQIIPKTISIGQVVKQNIKTTQSDLMTFQVTSLSFICFVITKTSLRANGTLFETLVDDEPPLYAFICDTVRNRDMRLTLT